MPILNWLVKSGLMQSLYPFSTFDSNTVNISDIDFISKNCQIYVFIDDILVPICSNYSEYITTYHLQCIGQSVSKNEAKILIFV